MHFIGSSPTKLQPGFDFSDTVLQAAPAEPCLLHPIPRHLTEVHWPELVHCWEAQILQALAQPVQLEADGEVRRVQVLGQLIFDFEPDGTASAYRWRQDHAAQRFALERLAPSEVVVQGIPEQSDWLDLLKAQALLALYRRFPDRKSDCCNYVAWVGNLMQNTYWGEGTQELVRRQIAEALALDGEVLAAAGRIQLSDRACPSVRLQAYNRVMQARAPYLTLLREAPQLLQLYAMLTDDPVGEVYQDALPEEPTARMKQQLQRHRIGPAMWRLIGHEGSDWMKPLLGFFDLSEQCLVDVAVDLLTVAQAFGTQALAPEWLLHAFLQLGGSPNRPRSAYVDRLYDLFPLCARMGHLLEHANEATKALMQARAAEIFNWGCDHLDELPDRSLRHISLRGLLRRVELEAGKEALALEGAEGWHIPYLLTLTEGRFRPVILDSPQAVWLEGKRMHHCAADYIDRCARGTMLMVSLRDAAQARPHATMAFDLAGPQVQLMQVSGFANRLVEPIVHWAARCCLEQLQAQKRAWDLARGAGTFDEPNDNQLAEATATPGTVACDLTRSDNYIETLNLRPVPALPGQYEWLVQSRLLSARRPKQWHRRHQLIVDRAALLALRASLDALLDGAGESTQGPEDGAR